MKKKISLAICALLTWATLSVPAFAADTIIEAKDAVFTNNGESVTATNYSTSEWGDGTHGARGFKYSAGWNPKAEYTSLPAGIYRVWYHVPDNHLGDYSGRNTRILDVDIAVKDKNGTYNNVSVKDYILDNGYKDLGVYEFSGTGDSITITLNQDNKNIKGQWDPDFLVDHIKLEPLTEERADLLSAVNGAANAGDIETAVAEKGTNYVDEDALFDMSDVYDELYSSRPTDGWTSSYHFKRDFDKCVENGLTAVEIPASSFVWQTSVANTESNGWRINWPPVQLTHKENTNIAVATFKFTNTDHIKRLELKLNPYSSDNLQNNVVITKYSGDVYENPSSAKTQNTAMNKVTFTDLKKEKRLMLSAKDIADDQLLAAIEKNGYLSLYMRAEYLNYADTNAGKLELSEKCTITAYYDLTYLGGKASLSYSDSEGKALDAKSVPVTTESVIITGAKGKTFTDYNFMDYMSVYADGKKMAESEYSLTKLDDGSLEFKVNDGFAYAVSYSLESDKYVSFTGGKLSYEFAAKFTIEKYPAEFSGVKMKSDGKTITSLKGIKGKSVSIESEIKNNSLATFDACLIVNLYEKTDNGIKMIDSKMKSGKIAKNGSIELTGTFEIPDTTADRFIAAYIYDGIKTMNFVKMYNSDSYVRID